MAKKSATKKGSAKKSAAKKETKKIEAKKGRLQSSQKKTAEKKSSEKVRKATAKKTKMTKKSIILENTEATALQPTDPDTSEAGEITAAQNPATTIKAVKQLLARGKKQGYLTYDEINELIPEEMLSPEQIDETLIMFDENEIEVIDEKTEKKLITQKREREKRILPEKLTETDFGTVTDPVKMYLREMGLVTLLSREGEVEIAKKIEAGEQEVLHALLETTTGSENIIRLGEEIE